MWEKWRRSSQRERKRERIRWEGVPHFWIPIIIPSRLVSHIERI
jgi:hypothetical protein